MTNYINGFNERYIQCADVDLKEAIFRFLDGLEAHYIGLGEILEAPRPQGTDASS